MFVDFTGPAGRLEGIFTLPEDPRFAAIVCHPHPLFGGTMHNHATFRLARALGERGGVTLRFHFRGVGRSEGVHDQGRGEIDDAQAAIAHLIERAPKGLPVWATGFSFGARAALAVAGRPAVAARAALVIGVAVRKFDHAFARELAIPVAAVQAERDEFGGPAEVEAVLSARPGPFRLGVVPGAGHLFTDDLDRLEQEVGAAADWLISLPGTTGDALPPVSVVE
jgi:uncharacterized protein